MRFECTRCGDCCFDQTVWLEPWDLLGLRGERTTGALFAAGVVALELDVDLWKCRLLPFERRMFGSKACRFVQPMFDEADRCTGFGCALHGSEAKPFVCRSAPLARRVGARRLELVAPVEGCPGLERGPERSPDELLSAAGIDRTRLALSRWFWDELAPLVLSDRARAARAFDFDVDGRIAGSAALTQKLMNEASMYDGLWHAIHAPDEAMEHGALTAVVLEQ